MDFSAGYILWISIACLMVGALLLIMGSLSIKHIKRLVIPGVILVLVGATLFIGHRAVENNSEASEASEDVADAPSTLNDRCVELKKFLKKDGFELDKDKHGNERCATAEKQSGSDAADVNEDDIVAYIREDDGVVGYLLTDDGQGGFEVVTSNAHLQDN